ncbi:SIR2 family protein [Jonesiaceae bacterium BS-20]|uniref:SIR2 family protein n=1 Tax=Jonesiaceae bacterium BS-20 TaxID=3120821 RepID=A0AAU7DSV1_9MICO
MEVWVEMRFIDGVDIPEEVLKAHSEGRLVLFVGAGVSKSEPSSLPLFHELARQLGDRARQPFEKIHEEQIDTFIGSLPERFDSHYHAAELLRPEGSAPNDLHRAIAKVAHSSGKPKIVTTNFDTHLSTAAQELSIDLGDLWIGPALPLGRDFSGIVHLHGSLSRDHDELILDDRGFGRAYFGDGWAPRFLQPMFSENVVLFIGYSLSDTVMRYLTLGLPSKTSRYVLVQEGEENGEALLRLQVTPITYPNPDGSYSELPRVLHAWADWKSMRTDDHKDRISEIVSVWEADDPEGESRLPQLSVLDEDYLLAQLSTVEGVKVFTELATSFKWLEWVERVPEHKVNFDPKSEISDVSRIFAQWFASTYVGIPARSSAAMLALRRQGQKIHPVLIQDIAFALHDLRRLDIRAAQKWQVFLATSLHDYSAPRPLEHLLPLTGENRSLHTAIVRQALTPFLSIRSSFATLWQETAAWPRTEIAWPLRTHDMQEYIGAWVDSQDVTDLAKLQILESALVSAYEMLDAYNGLTMRGVLEIGRSAIEPHSQDNHVEPIDIIINALRDIGAAMPKISPPLYERWWETGFGLFQRLALHLIACSPGISSDEKIIWLLDREILFDLGTKHEAFQVLKFAVPSATPSTRDLLLKKVLAGDPEDREYEGWERTREYEIYNLLVWLTRADPNWRQATDELTRIQQENLDFGERTNPDFSMWHGSADWVPEPDPPVAEFSELIEADPFGALEWFGELNRKGSRLSEDPYDAAYALLRGIAFEHPNKGISIWNVAGKAKVGGEGAGFLSALVVGWTQAELRDVELPVLRLVEELKGEETSLRTVTTFLLEQSRKNHDGPDSTFLKEMRILAQSVWDNSKNSFKPYADARPSDLALNSWPSDLVRFWISQVQRRWRHETNSWKGLNNQESTALESLLQGPEDALYAVWPAVGSELYFFDAADPEFTDSYILPLFSNKKSVRHVWEPFLFHSRVSPRVLEAGLLTALVEAFESLSDLELGGLEDQFVSLTASVVNFAPLEGEERQRILDAAVIAENGDHATKFASEVVKQLQQDSLKAEAAWNLWIHEYLQQRLKGIPRTATKAELSGWASIVPMVGSNIPDAIALFKGKDLSLNVDRGATECIREVLEIYGSELVAFFAELIGNSDPAEFLAEYRVKELVDLVRDSLGDECAQQLIDSATNAGFRRQNK